MTDLKTITDGLRHHIDRTCAGCPYSKFIKAPDGCLLGGLMPEALEALTEQNRHINELHKGIVELREALKAAREAAALVKAQPPRLMTLEEALSSDECWIEGRNGACGYGDALLTDDEKHVKFFRPHIINTLDFYAYGKIWRCWTARPTDEQRKAVKWDAGD